MDSRSALPERAAARTLPGLIVLMVAVAVVAALVFIALVLSANAATAPATSGLASFLGLGTTQAWWYVTRAAGIMAYLLTWWSTIWGLGLASRLFHPAVEGAQSYDFHEFVSLLALGFMILHAAVLMVDRFLPFSLAQVLVPFTSTYRPFWVGLGVIGFYVFLLVTVTFYLRRSIGARAFRAIHVLSLLGYVGATLHGLLAGTDATFSAAKGIYAGTFLAVVFLGVYWLVMTSAASGGRDQARALGSSSTRGGDPRSTNRASA